MDPIILRCDIPTEIHKTLDGTRTRIVTGDLLHKQPGEKATGDA